jgi:hypothetical protein
MTKKIDRPVLLVDLDGIIAQWQKWGGSGPIGLPVGHNIIQVARWKKSYPEGKVIVRLSEGPRDPSHNIKAMAKRCRRWLSAHDVIYDEISIQEKRPAFTEHWKSGK